MLTLLLASVMTSPESTPAQNESTPLLPDTIPVQDWLESFNENPKQVLDYHGAYQFAAMDDVVDSSIAVEQPDDVYTVKVMCQVAHSGMGFKVRGHITGTLPFVCDRTLDIFTQPVDISVEERFLITDNLPKEYHNEEWVTQYADETDAYGKDDMFDLRDWVRQWLVLETSGRHVMPGTEDDAEGELDED